MTTNPEIGRGIEITYSFKVPDGVTPKSTSTRPTLNPEGKYFFEVGKSPSDGIGSYYEGVLAALKEAKNVTGEALTAWRDAVGDTEKAKEVSVKKPVNEDDEEEEEPQE